MSAAGKAPNRVLCRVLSVLLSAVKSLVAGKPVLNDVRLVTRELGVGLPEKKEVYSETTKR